MNVIQQRTVRGYEERKNTYTCLKNTCDQIMTNSLIIWNFEKPWNRYIIISNSIELKLVCTN